VKHFVAVSIAVFLFVLNGCGGSNSSSNTPGNSSTPGQAQGVFTGTTSTGFTFDSIILPNDTFYAVYGTASGNNLFVQGMLTGKGASNNGKYTATVTDYQDTGVTLTGSITASYVPGSSVGGTFTEGTNSETFSATALPSSAFSYNRAAVLSDITGTWAGTLMDGTTAITAINADGSFSGSDSGCSFSGTITPDSSGKNFFKISFTFGASPCLFPNQTQSGIAVDYMLSDGITQQLVAGFAGVSSGNVFVANR